jgi:soluble lytic murein transglycosylase
MKRRWLFLLVLLLLGLTAACLWREARLEKKFLSQMLAAGTRFGVDPLLVKAIVWRESRFHPDVRGSRGEIGLMQVQEPAAREWADAERLAHFNHELCSDPGTNTMAGTFYIGKLLKRYAATDNPLPYALADYNAGRGNVLKWNTASAGTNSVQFIAQIHFPATRAYVKSVMRRYALYRFLSRFGWA